MAQIIAGMQHAYEQETDAFEITLSSDSGKFQSTPIRSRSIFYAFNSDFHAVGYGDLLPVDNGPVAPNVNVVMFQAMNYVHDMRRFPRKHGKEIARYGQLSGCDGC